MPANKPYFRDEIVVNQDLSKFISDAASALPPGSTLLIAGRNCKHDPGYAFQVPPGYNLMLLVDQYDAAGGLIDASGLPAPGQGTTGRTGTSSAGEDPGGPGGPGGPGPTGNMGGTITLFAKNLINAHLVSNGGQGGKGGTGGYGGAPTKYRDPDQVGGWGYSAPGRGGQGGPGGPGGLGGRIAVVCVDHPGATLPLPVDVAGGQGGVGGGGGLGAMDYRGRFRAPSGNTGPRGPSGQSGQSSVSQVSEQEYWARLLATIGMDAAAWAAYRTEVGRYFFRLFDLESQLLALGELTTALRLDSTNAEAQTLLNRLVQRQTVTGLSRDVDISPDYKDLSATLPAEVTLVQNAFAAAALALVQQETAEGFKDQFTSLVQQLTDRQAEAQDDVKIAQEDVDIAKQTSDDLSDQIKSTKNQLQALQNQPFSLGTFLTNVGSLVSSIASLASGIGTIVSIPGEIVALNNLIANPDDLGNPYIDGVTGFLKDVIAGQQGDHDKSISQVLSKIGIGLGDLMKGANVGTVLVNFQTIEAELDGAASKAGQTQAAQLAKQLSSLLKQQMIAQLREKQANDRVAAAQRKTQDLASEAKTAQNLLQNWSDNATYLEGAVNACISTARQLLDIVAEDVFFARRALEIYELDDASDVRFSYGYLHPDDDDNLDLIKRVNACQNSVAALAPTVLTWNDVYTRLNVAESSGFDVVHPAITVSITDPAVLAHLSSGGGLQFSIDPAATPAAIYELKVDSLEIELDGASATSPVLFWIEHSGHWKMVPRPPNQATLSEFALFPRVEVFNCKAATGKLSASIPEHPASSTEPGPPFSFWGRGVIADFRLFPDASAHGLDVSQLKALNLTIGCIGLVARGGAQPARATIRPATRLLPARKFKAAVADPALAA
jgi:hypothetical protein